MLVADYPSGFLFRTCSLQAQPTLPRTVWRHLRAVFRLHTALPKKTLKAFSTLHLQSCMHTTPAWFICQPVYVQHYTLNLLRFVTIPSVLQVHELWDFKWSSPCDNRRLILFLYIDICADAVMLMTASFWKYFGTILSFTKSHYIIVRHITKPLQVLCKWTNSDSTHGFLMWNKTINCCCPCNTPFVKL